MKQSKIGSLIEASLNAIIGYSVAVLSQIVIFPMFDVIIPLKDDLLIGLWFTVISITRSYIIRRWFEGKLHKLTRKK